MQVFDYEFLYKSDCKFCLTDCGMLFFLLQNIYLFNNKKTDKEITPCQFYKNIAVCSLEYFQKDRTART